MTDLELAGIGVLVTRPEQQAEPLAAAIEAAGGTAFRFPAIEIVPRPEDAIAADAASPLPPRERLPRPRPESRPSGRRQRLRSRRPAATSIFNRKADSTASTCLPRLN